MNNLPRRNMVRDEILNDFNRKSQSHERLNSGSLENGVWSAEFRFTLPERGVRVRRAVEAVMHQSNQYDYLGTVS